MLLQSTRLKLEPLSSKFCTQKYVSWLNDLDINKFLETKGGYTLNSLNSYLENIENNNILAWAILIKENNKHIGNIKIDPINHRHGLGEYGILLGDKTEWHKGYAQEASKLVIDYCFKELNLRKINLGVVAKNVGALNLYKELGFCEEAVYKSHGKYDGEYCDVVRMFLFNENFIDQ